MQLKLQADHHYSLSAAIPGKRIMTATRCVDCVVLLRSYVGVRDESPQRCGPLNPLVVH